MSAPVIKRSETGEFDVTVERAEDGVWTVTATALDNETLARYTAENEVEALTLGNVLRHADISDLM